MGLLRAAVLPLAGIIVLGAQNVPPPTDGIPKFQIRSGGLELTRATHPGAFFDVVGRRAAILGYENREAEAWVYPLEIVDGLSLSFRLEGYPLDIDGRTILSSIAVQPETTTFVYAHAAFTVREIMLVPVNEPGIVILLDVQSVLPISITVSFRPRLRLMWPATAMTASIGWDGASRVYSLTEESGRYAGIVGCPFGRDVSVMPYQEEPRDVPNRFVIVADRTDRPRTDGTQSAERIDLTDRFVPIVITGSLEGRDAAKRTYDRILASIPSLYAGTADYYDQLDRATLSVETPDERINTAFRWAKVGIDKGLATNPSLGTGLLAGFRTAGESERPGYAWFFGRDSMWTALATTAAGAFDTTRAALEFLRKYQRADGKIPHEISQSAGLIPWFDEYPYAWASADATPLYVIAHVDYWHASGDRAFIEAAWPSLVKAYRFSAATDTDRNDLIENTNVGHGWVEGGALYPPHEEMYLQGLWVAAAQGMADLATVMRDETLAADARASAERTRASMERTYWLESRGFYAFATARPARLVEEDTVLPAVPLWFGTVRADRAQQEIDHLGSGAIETDWGARILSNRSALYDPLSYHYGSVWPLFTGWAAVGAYRYGRPHVGYDALMANVLLTFPGALGYVTELLSGDFATAFGRSSHHQIWSEAMVINPIVRGMLGLEAADAGGTLRLSPALPATWDRVSARGVRVGDATYDVTFERSSERATVRVMRRSGAGGVLSPGTEMRPQRLVVAPAFPTDARVKGVTVNGARVRPEVIRIGDEQRAQVTIAQAGASTDVVFAYDEGTDVEATPREPVPGVSNEGLRLLRAWADARALHLVAEGRGGRAYTARVRSPKRIGAADGVTLLPRTANVQPIQIAFDGAQNEYVRRTITLPLSAR
jgi:glycogen debranching enzyme